MKTKDKVSDIPQNNILMDIMECKIEDLRNGQYKNNTIKSLVKNLKKPKNLFMYYPYEYADVSIPMLRSFETAATNIFKNVLSYRDELSLQKDTFVCFKINRYFVILEWVNKALVVIDKVDDLLCANYRDAKTYSVY